MLNKLSAFLLFVLIFLMNTTEAAKIDAYRDILMSRSYTIRYNNLTPAPRVTNRDKAALHGKNGLATGANDLFVNRPMSGIVVSDGNDRYEEVGYDDFFQCRLTKNDENFIFTKYKSKTGTGFDYYGKRKGKVEANNRNYLAELIDGESFGDADFSKLLNAILNNDEKSADMAEYSLVDSGTLDNGMTYEDFSSDDNGELSAIRYYFNGDKLVKISFASYSRDKFGKAQGSKCIVKVLEFSSKPDLSLLTLPSGLEDITKR